MDCDFRMPNRPENSHKGTFGRVLNISGSDYMTGAAYLSSTAALKTGCGYVVLCSAERVINAVAAQSSNIVFKPLSAWKNQLQTADVLLVGCGLSTSDGAEALFSTLPDEDINIPAIIDADGLNLLAKLCPKTLPENLILTPHPKEASRLLNVPVEDILGNMEYYAKEISKKYNCVTVLKSHHTIVCSKDLEIYVNHTGNSALAKAGSGDVLSGMIAGLAAQGCEPYYAAKLGVYLHGLCGDLAKNDLTEYGVLASDLIRYIPSAVKTLL
ncbi:NAD(P)H-hydrate dehydratase [bacterium]|nr:NAD(P)H-hydrate dehydratase [bacterium]